jgi:AbiV family abortive infection protein
VKKKLDQYRGKLTLEQIAEGMNLANRNALRLHQDAEAMLYAGRYPTALSLAILSIEEAGKGTILRRMVDATTDDEVVERWKEYRSHTKKNVQWTIIDMIRDGPTKLEEFRSLFAEDAEHPYVLDQLKQIGFYTDCLGKAHWSDPVEAINGDLARGIVTIARIFCRDHEITPRELQLWLDHMGNATKTGYLPDAKRLANWYAAMQAEGLYPEGQNAMAEFLKKGFEVVPKTDG